MNVCAKIISYPFLFYQFLHHLYIGTVSFWLSTTDGIKRLYLISTKREFANIIQPLQEGNLPRYLGIGDKCIFSWAQS